MVPSGERVTLASGNGRRRDGFASENDVRLKPRSVPVVEDDLALRGEPKRRQSAVVRCCADRAWNKRDIILIGDIRRIHIYTANCSIFDAGPAKTGHLRSGWGCCQRGVKRIGRSTNTCVVCDDQFCSRILRDDSIYIAFYT